MSPHTTVPGMSREANGLLRCFAIFTTSLWSFNQMFSTWEPVLEPMQLLLHVSHLTLRLSMCSCTRHD